MKFTRNSSDSSGPSSAIGIMRFFDTDTGGPKISPEFVVVFSVVVIVAVAAFRIFG